MNDDQPDLFLRAKPEPPVTFIMFPLWLVAVLAGGMLLVALGNVLIGVHLLGGGHHVS
jgi:hypothetical protein